MLTKKLQCVLVGVAAAFAASTAPGALINYDTGATKPTGAGVVGAAGDVWNQATGGTGWKNVSNWNVADLLDSTGASSGASLVISQNPAGHNGQQAAGVRWNDSYTGAPFPPTNNPAPFDHSVGDAAGAVFAYTVSGLDTSNPYDVYVLFGYGAGARTFDPVTVNNGASQSARLDSTNSDPVEGEDYLLFSNITASGGIIDISVPGPDTNVGLSGFQLQQLQPIQQIPEPSTLLIWSLGLLALGWFGRRRKR